jgi:bile acid-coenzyme A ligase
VKQASFVAINLPNGTEHVVGTLAAYKLGACPMPVSYRMPAAERDQLMALAEPAAVLGDAQDLKGITRAQMRALESYPATPPPDAVPQPQKAIASGGSTGKPKLIVTPSAFAFAPGAHPATVMWGLNADDRLYSPGPLYHSQAFALTQIILFLGGSVVLNEKFDADKCLAAIEKHRPTVLNLVPTMMLRMLRSDKLTTADLSSVRSLWHLASPCPDWVKRGWIERIGAEKVNELWGATEATGVTVINGREWLQKPGSVGKGSVTESASSTTSAARCQWGRSAKSSRAPAARRQITATWVPSRSRRWMAASPASATSAPSMRTDTCSWPTGAWTRSSPAAPTWCRRRSRRS